jgi:hypothetical protein
MKPSLFVRLKEDAERVEAAVHKHRDKKEPDTQQKDRTHSSDIKRESHEGTTLTHTGAFLRCGLRSFKQNHQILFVVTDSHRHRHRSHRHSSHHRSEASRESKRDRRKEHTRDGGRRDREHKHRSSENDQKRSDTNIKGEREEKHRSREKRRRSTSEDDIDGTKGRSGQRYVKRYTSKYLMPFLGTLQIVLRTRKSRELTRTAKWRIPRNGRTAKLLERVPPP